MWIVLYYSFVLTCATFVSFGFLHSTKVYYTNGAHGDVYVMQRYVIKIVSDLRQVGGFL
jgi:hypothetical protein